MKSTLNPGTKASVRACDVRPITVNYDSDRWLSFKGAYDYIDTRLGIEHFPINRSGVAELSFLVVSLTESCRSTDVPELLAAANLRLPSWPESESFLDRFDDQNGEVSIVCLCGDIVTCRGLQYIAVLSGNCHGRRLSLRFVDFKWPADTSFLVVAREDRPCTP